MKKALVVLLILAVAGGAFAQVDVSANAYGKIDVVKGSTADGQGDIGTGGAMTLLRVGVSGETDDGVFGGWIRLQSFNLFDIENLISGDDPVQANQWGGFVRAWGYAWWQPIDIFRLTIGANPDGHFGADGVARWGFYGEPNDVGTTFEDYRFSSSFFGGYGQAGAILTVETSGLEVNIGIPFIWGSDALGDGLTLEKGLKNTTVQVAYTIDDIGKLAVTYAGSDDAAGDPNGTIFVYFGLTALDLGDIDLGFSYDLDSEFIGIGVATDLGLTDEIGLKVRAQFVLGGDDPVIDVGLLPYYKIDDSFKIYLGIGIKYESDLDWHVNPYISKTVGSGSFYAGFSVGTYGYYGEGSLTTPADKIKWSIPIGIGFNF